MNVLYWNKNKEPRVRLKGFSLRLHQAGVQLNKSPEKMSRSWTIGLLPVVPKNVKRPREHR